MKYMRLHRRDVDLVFRLLNANLSMHKLIEEENGRNPYESSEFCRLVAISLDMAEFLRNN